MHSVTDSNRHIIMIRVTAKSNSVILVSRHGINIDIVLMLCSILKYVNKFSDDWIHLHFSAIFANGNDLRISIFFTLQ